MDRDIERVLIYNNKCDIGSEIVIAMDMYGQLDFYKMIVGSYKQDVIVISISDKELEEMLLTEEV